MANAEVSIFNEQHQFAINISIPFNGLSPEIFIDHRWESLFFVDVKIFVNSKWGNWESFSYPSKNKIFSLNKESTCMYIHYCWRNILENLNPNIFCANRDFSNLIACVFNTDITRYYHCEIIFPIEQISKVNSFTACLPMRFAVYGLILGLTFDRKLEFFE